MQTKSTPQQNNNKTKPIFQFLPGPVKIKDGLFMGDEIAAKDIEFIISNKVTHIINTVSKKIPNLWQRFGIHYLSVNWTQKQQNIFDKKNNAVNTIFHFVQQAMQQGQSCLIHSVNGKSRSCAVLVAYLMKKYSWSLDKCLEFIASKKENLEIRNGYLLQLKQLDQRISQIYNLSSTWQNPKTQQQLILKNTFTNSQPPTAQISKPSKKVSKHISWGQKPIVHKVNANKTYQPPQKGSQMKLRSILKGDKQQEELIKNIEQNQSFQQFGQTKGPKKQKNFINNINGNIVHVTVNNFITSDKNDKKKQQKTPVNTRPYSSDQKERDKQKQKKIINQKKLLVYDTNPMISMKSPYDSKIANRIGSNSKIPKPKKQQKQVKQTTYERPQSAKHRTAPINNNRLKQDLVIMNSGANSISGQQKKRYPSNPRQQFFKRR